MPRALRGRFEPLDHFVLGHFHLATLGSLWVAARRETVHWSGVGIESDRFSIGVRGKDGDQRTGSGSPPTPALERGRRPRSRFCAKKNPVGFFAHPDGGSVLGTRRPSEPVREGMSLLSKPVAVCSIADSKTDHDFFRSA